MSFFDFFIWFRDSHHAFYSWVNVQFKWVKQERCREKGNPRGGERENIRLRELQKERERGKDKEKERFRKCYNGNSILTQTINRGGGAEIKLTLPRIK